MTNENKAILLAVGLLAWFVAVRPDKHAVDPASPTPVRRPGRFDDVDIQLIKVDLFAKQLDEAQAQLKRFEDQARNQVTGAPAAEADLADHHAISLTEHAAKHQPIMVPMVQTSLTRPPAAVTPGMEPSKEQTPSVPVQTPIRASAGHWEAYGFLGRQRRWVSEYSVPVSQASPQRSGIPVLRRFGSCRGGSCGG